MAIKTARLWNAPLLLAMMLGAGACADTTAPSHPPGGGGIQAADQCLDGSGCPGEDPPPPPPTSLTVTLWGPSMQKTPGTAHYHYTVTGNTTPIASVYYHYSRCMSGSASSCSLYMPLPTNADGSVDVTFASYDYSIDLQVQVAESGGAQLTGIDVYGLIGPASVVTNDVTIGQCDGYSDANWYPFGDLVTTNGTTKVVHYRRDACTFAKNYAPGGA